MVERASYWLQSQKRGRALRLVVVRARYPINPELDQVVGEDPVSGPNSHLLREPPSISFAGIAIALERADSIP